MTTWAMPREMDGFSELEASLLAAVNAAGLPKPEWEYRFDTSRRWRFDFAWPDVKVAVECEGGTWNGGRHTTGAGFEKDAEKYNAAALAGWAVLRFTQRQITSGEALTVIERALRSREG